MPPVPSARPERDLREVRVIRRGPTGERVVVNVPEVVSQACPEGAGDSSRMTIRSQHGERQRIVICVNRIEAAAARGAQAAEHAPLAALAALRHARASVLSNHSLSHDQRAHALDGIDQALDELQSQPADRD